MKDKGLDHMNGTKEKVAATLMVFGLGVIFFILTPLWVGICFVIPGFSFYLRHCLNQKLEFTDLPQREPLHKKGFVGYLGCNSLVARKNKYGF